MSRTNLVLQEARVLEDQFEELYGQKPRVYCAPGRVNLIGEHTDYNDGFVMPVAMDMYTWVASAPRDDSRVHVYSKNLSQHAEMDLQDVLSARARTLDRLRPRSRGQPAPRWTKNSRRELIGGRQSSYGCRTFIVRIPGSSGRIRVTCCVGAVARSRRTRQNLPARGK